MSTATHQALVEAVERYVHEVSKFDEKAVKAAGTRARAALSEIAKLAKVRRQEIQDAKSAIDVLSKEDARQEVAVKVAEAKKEEKTAPAKSKKK